MYISKSPIDRVTGDSRLELTSVFFCSSRTMMAVIAFIVWIPFGCTEKVTTVVDDRPVVGRSVDFKSVDVVPGFEADKVNVPALLSTPDGAGPFPAVVLLHTCVGFSDALTRSWPKYLNNLGYVTLAVDSLSSRSLGTCRDDREHYLNWVINDAYGALQYLGRLSFVDKQRIAVMGFSAGGTVTGFIVRHNFKTPGNEKFVAAVTLYARCWSKQLNIPEGGQVLIPWAMINGSNDSEGLVTSCQKLSGTPRVEHHLLEGAYHSFDNQKYTELTYRDGRRRLAPMLYSPKATGRAKSITRAFLEKYLGK